MKTVGFLGVFAFAAFLTSCDGRTESRNTAENSEPGLPRVLAAEIEVGIDRAALASYGLTPEDVYIALDAFISAQKVFSADDIRNISITLRHDTGASVKLSKVASVRINLSANRDALGG